jgi:ribonuclease HI
MKAYTDGACRCGNPGETSAAFATFNESELRFPWKSYSRYLGPELHTNNYAEYQGMLDLLRWSETNKVTGLEIFCDSKLVVEQVQGNWKVNEPSLLPFQREAHALFIRGYHTLTHIRGHQGDPGNEYVDKLCNEVLDAEFERRKNET